MKKFSLRIYLIFAITVIAFASCTRSPEAPEGFEHHNSLSHSYLIDYKEGECEVNISEENPEISYMSIEDKEGKFLVEVYATKADDDERYKFPYYQTIDSIFAGKTDSIY